MNSKERTLSMVKLALFSAIVLILASVPNLGYIPLGFTRATIIHIPVIVGAIVLGPKSGAFLGFLFGLTSLVNNTINPTVTSFVFTPFFSLNQDNQSWLSLLICFIPRILVGVVPYYVFAGVKKAKEKLNSLALVIAGVLGSLTNTILVMNMIYFIFGDKYAAAQGKASELFYLSILSVIGINGLPEAIVAGILTIAIAKPLLALNKKNL